MQPSTTEQQLDSYVIRRRLAPALFGDVLLCTHRPAGDRVAVKRILKSAAAARKMLGSKKPVRENVVMEREVYRCMAERGGHRNLLAMRNEIDYDGCLFMVFNYCSRGQLFHQVKNAKGGKLSVSTASKYVRRIASFVQFMHQNGYAHRDLSLDNVLVTADDECQVCDFGLAAPADQMCHEPVGKKIYMAPEVLRVGPKGYSPTKADVWSLGVTLFIMLVGTPIVDSATIVDTGFQIINSKGVRCLIQRWSLTDNLPSEAIDLLEGMLDVDPHRRFTIDNVVAHPFMNPHSVGRRTMAEAVPSTSTLASAVANSKDYGVASALKRVFFRRVRAVCSAQQHQRTASTEAVA